jgi:hypothetical protein
MIEFNLKYSNSPLQTPKLGYHHKRGAFESMDEVIGDNYFEYEKIKCGVDFPGGVEGDPLGYCVAVLRTGNGEGI